MRIGGFREHSSTDYPGKDASVIFTQGCNWQCPFCRSASLVIPDEFQRPIPKERVFAYLDQLPCDARAVVVTGGEPTIHGDLIDFLTELRTMRFSIKLDTNGSQPEVLRNIFQAKLVDYVAMDVKAPMLTYAQATGKRIDTGAIRSSIWNVKQCGVPYEFRTTVIPGLHTLNELKEIGNLVRGADRLVLQAYDSTQALRPDYRNRVAFTRKSLESMRKFFSRKVKHFEVRGTDQAASMPDPTCFAENAMAV